MKTVLCTHEKEGQPFVCKIFFKKEPKDISSQEKAIYDKYVSSLREIKDLFNLNTCPNVSPIRMIKDIPVINQ